MSKPKAVPRPVVRRRLSRAARRERITAGALQVFARDGYNDASMLEIAVASGITPPVLYQHYDSKQALFLAVLSEQSSSLAAAIGDAADPDSASLERRVLKTAGTIIDFVAENPAAWRLMRMTAPGDPTIADAYLRLRRGAHAVTARTTASDPDFTAPPGVGRAQAAELFGQLQWSAYEALGDWAAEHAESERPALLRIFMDFMWVGLQRFREGRHWPSG